ncbi:glycosyltransferase [Algibacter sp. L1A34]|uniref:glycosyltransferase n=1 Tax=Algibacter sp. L1A34 TaxID=2686365 RepID=UPI00131E7F13|nr:glycosyltransferase [Algibacter sp. L1A34]
MNKKICLLTDSLSSGGAEKMVANMSLSLSKAGYDVHILTMINDVSYNFAGKLYNFGLVKEKETKVKAFFKLKSFFKRHSFNVIIDHRMRDKFVKEFLLSSYVFKNFNIVYCIHSYELAYYFSKHLAISLMKFQHVKNRKFVAVSLEIKNQLKNQLKTESTLIYNYTLESQTKLPELKENKIYGNYIIGVGRLEKIKQFDVLINCYKNSKLSQNNIKLLIFGKGAEDDNLKQLIINLKLEGQVVIMGFDKNVLSFIEKAKALVLSSKHEGFGLVLIEALAVGTPVVSFDCECGPREIINHEVNGLLVEDQNQKELSNSINRLLDDDLYSKLKVGAIGWKNPFSEEKIINQWTQLLEGF